MPRRLDFDDPCKGCAVRSTLVESTGLCRACLKRERRTLVREEHREQLMSRIAELMASPGAH